MALMREMCPGGFDESDGGVKGAPGIEPLVKNGTFEVIDGDHATLTATLESDL